MAQISSEAANTDRARVAAAHSHADGSALSYLAGHRKLKITAIEQNTVDDTHGAAIRGNTIALFGDKSYAPNAIVAR